MTSSTANGLAMTAASLTDNQWMLAGHKVAVNGLTTDDVTAGSRWQRVWYMDETGSPTSSFTLTFDYSDSGLGAPTGRSFNLLYAADNDFETSVDNFTVLSTAFSQVGDQISFTLGGGSLPDGYYTLAEIAPVPEPSVAILMGVGGLLLRARRSLGEGGWRRSRRK